MPADLQGFGRPHWFAVRLRHGVMAAPCCLHPFKAGLVSEKGQAPLKMETPSIDDSDRPHGQVQAFLPVPGDWTFFEKW